MTVTGDWIDRLAEAKGTLARSSTAERVADVLRGHIMEGAMAPGARLSEEAIGAALGVSRNTLRESFRLLGHERLLVHEFHRGVFVARPGVEDVIDLYRVRRALELSALRGAERAPVEAVERVGAAVREGEEALRRSDWWGVGTANMHFHQAIAGLGGSPRIDEIMRQLLAELRLVFHVMAAPRDFHAPYLEHNRAIYELLRDGAPDAAADRLAEYLDVAERQLVDAFGRLDGSSAPGGEPE
ncbi:transcriptional regulator, GntR family [Marinactinospora thermotolerans DSM 45154]|uniref:Transcriptional regulator, GntR family n=1 Tax=Marinactinospora thermotolerans DSM 45154 TaxID=1122192 RepID=A0A1T4S492_9ACTN|nr:GntR family transcriptional regulator [Marinactinospora thermotolerans]SKA22957.1 transcriptional regulator, GntR family [Marinactinospora thermotolerans DSM 45154]